MTAGMRGGGRSIARTLWARAPLWRLCVLTAGLLTLLFILFPPGRIELAPPPVPASTASYTPHPRASSGAAAMAPGAPAAGATSSAPAASPAAPHSPKIRTGALGVPAVGTLAMVTPGTAKHADSSGVDDALVGRLYRGSVSVDGFAVPLPAGDWANLANSTIKIAAGAGNAHFLGRIRDRRLIGAVRIFAVRSSDDPGAGFGEVKSCTEANPARHFVFVDGEMNPQGHQGCWTVRNVYATPWSQWADRNVKISALDRAAAGDMTAKGVSFPQDFVAVTFTRTETWGLLEVMYLFSPEAEGISSNATLSINESDWTAPNVRPFPEKVAYVAKLKAWGTDFWPQFKAAFDAGSAK